MNILYTNFHHDDGGGHTTYIRSLAQGLALHHHVFVAAWPGSRLNREAKTIDSVTVLDQEFPRGAQQWSAWLRASRHLRAAILKHGIDIVHVNGSSDHRLVMRSIRGLKPRPVIVFTQHNTKPLISLGKRWRAKFGTDAVIAVCNYSRQQLETSPYRKCILETIHNGVDLNYFKPTYPDVMALEHQRWMEDGRLIIGSHAGTQESKGWIDLVEALALLPEKVRGQFGVVIAGRPIAPSLAERVSVLSFESHIEFVGLLDDVRPMLAALDVGFVLSHEETISFACREMMAMGKPVLSSDSGGLPENIESGMDGWIVPAHDHHAIAKELLAILKKRDHLPYMGRAARKHAETSFGLQAFIDKTERVYHEVVERRADGMLNGR